MAGPTPDQVLAVDALLQQVQQTLEAQNSQLQQQSFPVAVQSSTLSTDLTALTRALTIDGTAVLSANLDQILVRSAAGNVMLQVQQQQDQQLLDMLPARVTLQLRPGPDGLQAALVVGPRAALPDKPVDSVASGTALSSNQTLAPEIPKIGQINQALVLPASLFSNHAPEEFLAQLNAQVSGKLAPFSPPNAAPNAATVNPAPNLLADKNLPPEAEQLSQSISQNLAAGKVLPANTELPAYLSTQNFVSSILQRLGFTPAPAPQLPAGAVVAQGLVKPVPNAVTASPQAAPQSTTLKILAVGPTVSAAGEGQIAIVRGNTPSGQPVLSIGDQFVAVQGAKNWPLGLQVKVLLGGAAGLVTENPDSSPAHNFTALRQILETLATASPQTYADFARIRLPQPSQAQLPGSLLFLFSALQKGAPEWVGGDVAEKLKALGKEELIRALGEQWRSQMSQDAEGPGGQWRGMTIPLFDQERMNALKFYVYDPPDQRGKPKRDPAFARRFLIDFSLTQLGPIQLDGLVHKKRLDLVVRTARPFDAALRHELVAHFNRTLEEVRYAGDLRFAANKTGWVDIRDTFQSPVTTKI